MADEINKENWQEKNQYQGLNTVKRADQIGPYEAAEALNSDFSTTSVRPMKGYSLFGNQVNTDNVITRTYTYSNNYSYQILLQVRDDGTNSYVEYLNPGDTRNSSNGEWLILVGGLTTAIRSDGTVNPRRVMGFTGFNTGLVDNLLFCNAADNFSRWSGSMCVADGAITAGAATINVKALNNYWKSATDGFGNTGSFRYRDTAGNYVTVTYTGKTTTSFTGCTGATDSANNTGICDIADTSTYSGVPKNNILITALGRVWGSGRDSAPNALDCSKVEDFTDWSTSTDPSDAQSAQFPELGYATALASIDEWIFLLSDKSVLANKFDITNIADGLGGYTASLTRIKRYISNVGCANQKCISRVGDDYWYITPQGMIRRLGKKTVGSTTDNFVTEDISFNIYPTVSKFIWTDAASAWSEQEQMFIISGRSDKTVSMNDKAIVCYVGEGDQGQKMNSFSMCDWFIGDIEIYNDLMYFGSSIESRTFKAFDGFTKDGAPYVWRYTTRIENFGSEWTKKEIRYLAVTGNILSGTTVTFRLYYNELGSLGVSEMQLEASDSRFVYQQPLNTLNSFELGLQPLNGTNDDAPNMNPFRVIFPLPNSMLPYNVQLEISTSGSGQNVEVVSHAFDVSDAAEHADWSIFSELGISQ